VPNPRAFDEREIQARGAQPREVGDGSLGSGEDGEVGRQHLRRRGREGDRDAGLVGESVEVGEVADASKPDDRNPQNVPPKRRPYLSRDAKSERVLAVDLEPRYVRQRPEERAVS
jgi:hypothetical protein